MPSVVSVLLVEADQRLVRKRAEPPVGARDGSDVTGSRRLVANPMARGRQRTAGGDDRCDWRCRAIGWLTGHLPRRVTDRLTRLLTRMFTTTRRRCRNDLHCRAAERRGG